MCWGCTRAPTKKSITNSFSIPWCSSQQEKSVNLYIERPSPALDRSTLVQAATGAAVARGRQARQIIHTQRIHCGSSVSLMWKPVNNAGLLQLWVKVSKLKHQNNIAAGRVHFQFTAGTWKNGAAECSFLSNSAYYEGGCTNWPFFDPPASWISTLT